MLLFLSMFLPLRCSELVVLCAGQFIFKGLSSFIPVVVAVLVFIFMFYLVQYHLLLWESYSSKLLG